LEQPVREKELILPDLLEEEMRKIYRILADIEEHKKFRDHLPVYSLQAAAGYFGDGKAVDPEGWIEVAGFGRLDKRMFVARALGRSMEPRIHDGDLLVFRSHPVGSRQRKIVLVQYHGLADPETGGSYTVKRYRSEKSPSVESEWKHTKITLEPLNPEFEPIILEPEDEGAIQVIAEYIGKLGGK
jgi:phage repressor protein C with HTH and peptisase S24 domain